MARQASSPTIIELEKPNDCSSILSFQRGGLYVVSADAKSEWFDSDPVVFLFCLPLASYASFLNRGCR